ncbi:MAG: response regulator [Deltaproteobacteria bacterium]|nr:response regulator [Deltaproteobacteria bacterium]
MRAETERPDAVIMDIKLRDDMDGIEAAEQIYSRFEIPVLFMSAYSDRGLLDRAKRVGSFGYLVKPLNERELYAMLEMALYKSKAEKQRRQVEARLLQAQKMEVIGTLAGGIAHQFNNALYVITGNLDMLEMDFNGDEKVADYTKKIEASARRMTQLVAQLLAYARGGKYHIKTLSLSDFVIDTLSLLKHSIGNAIQLDTDLPSDILNVEADLNQMQMVLSDVLRNAFEAMDGKGCIRIACRNTMITDEIVEDFPGLKPGNYVKLTITDDGRGMDQETRKRIFEPFFTTKFEGRGLGMAAAYGIVKNHGGWISVDSEPGQGTILTIYLPATQAKVQKPEQSKIERIKGTGTILVIEDEEMVMAVCREMLERLGYHVLEAKTGQEAINAAKTYGGEIDLAMLDILLPDMSGNTIYPFLMEARPNLKVIVYSGYSIDGPAEEIIDAGAQDFLQKPFTIAALSEKLKKVLEGK